MKQPSWWWANPRNTTVSGVVVNGIGVPLLYIAESLAQCAACAGGHRDEVQECAVPCGHRAHARQGDERGGRGADALGVGVSLGPTLSCRAGPMLNRYRYCNLCACRHVYDMPPGG